MGKNKRGRSGKPAAIHSYDWEERRRGGGDGLSTYLKESG